MPMLTPEQLHAELLQSKYNGRRWEEEAFEAGARAVQKALVPMTPEQVTYAQKRTGFTDELYDTQAFEAGVRAAEAHHGIVAKG